MNCDDYEQIYLMIEHPMQYLGEDPVTFFSSAFHTAGENVCSEYAEIFDLSIVTEELVRKHRQKYANEQLD
jgi:hypothetical protein